MMQQFGAPTLTLSQVVDNMMGMQRNSMRQYYPAYLTAAKWAWKQMLLSTVYSGRIVVLNVDPETGTVRKPSDVFSWVQMQVVGCDDTLLDVVFNPDFQPVDLEAHAQKCSCSCHGSGTLCAVVESIGFRTEEIEVDGSMMNKRIYNRRVGCELQEVTETPVYDSEANDVVYLTSYSKVCDLSLTTSGCVADTADNRECLVDHCGCFITPLQKWCCPQDFYEQCRKTTRGEWNWDLFDKDLIHVRNAGATKVILSYQSNGECGGSELMVPEYAAVAVMAGIRYMQAMVSPATSPGEFIMADRTFKAQRNEVAKLFNRIDPDLFVKVSTARPKL